MRMGFLELLKNQSNTQLAEPCLNGLISASSRTAFEESLSAGQQQLYSSESVKIAIEKAGHSLSSARQFSRDMLASLYDVWYRLDQEQDSGGDGLPTALNQRLQAATTKLDLVSIEALLSLIVGLFDSDSVVDDMDSDQSVNPACRSLLKQVCETIGILTANSNASFDGSSNALQKRMISSSVASTATIFFNITPLLFQDAQGESGAQELLGGRENQNISDANALVLMMIEKLLESIVWAPSTVSNTLENLFGFFEDQPQIQSQFETIMKLVDNVAPQLLSLLGTDGEKYRQSIAEAVDEEFSHFSISAILESDRALYGGLTCLVRKDAVQKAVNAKNPDNHNDVTEDNSSSTNRKPLIRYDFVFFRRFYLVGALFVKL